MNGICGTERATYRAGKWGRYVRAPDLYFDIMRRFGNRFVPLGEIADDPLRREDRLRRLLHAQGHYGCRCLRRTEADREFRRNAGGASPRRDVESGKLKIIQGR